MADFSDSFEATVANLFRGQNATGFTPYLALFSRMPAEDGTGGVEVTTTIRAAGRPTVAFAAPTTVDTAKQIANSADVNFGGAAGAADVVGFGFYDAASAGDLKALKAFKAAPVTISIASPGVVSWAAHGLVNGDAVRLTSTGSLPTGLSPDTTYYVVSAATDTFSLASTPGGSAVATSGSQSGIHTASLTRVVTKDATIIFAAGTLTLGVR